MLAGGEPATPHPVEATPEAITPAPATTEPPAELAQAEAEAVGPIPLERHKAALENARKKATEEASQQFQQQYGPALDIVRRLSADLPNTLGQLLDEALTSEQYGPAVKAMLGRKLGGMRQRAQSALSADDPEPSMFVEQNGEKFFDPSALPKWQQWNERRIKAAVAADMEQKFAPVVQLSQQVEQAKAYQKLKSESEANVDRMLEHWKQAPGFLDHKDAIAAKQQELFAAGMPFDQALGIAYAQVVPARLQAKSTNDLIRQAADKSRGSTANPIASAPAQPRKFRTPDEAIDAAFAGAMQK